MLSAGQRQRVGLARALFREPQVIVLDEPNANLDRVGENALQQALKTLHQRGATVIMVVHHAKMLENTNKLLLLEEGRISAFGPRDEVLARLSKNEQEERAPSKSAMPEPTLVRNPAPKQP